MYKFKKIKGKTTWVALKFDMEKAYDRLECDYKQKCLEQYGFHAIWIKWIMECITLVSYFLSVNDEHLVLLTLPGEFDKGTHCLHIYLYYAWK